MEDLGLEHRCERKHGPRKETWLDWHFKQLLSALVWSAAWKETGAVWGDQVGDR